MKLISTLFLCASTTLSFGQDIIQFKDGEKVVAHILSIDRREIKFKRFDDLSGPTYFVERRQVAQLTYADLITETLHKHPPRAPKVTQITDTPIRSVELPESTPASQNTIGLYVRDCMATFRRVSLKGVLVR